MALQIWLGIACVLVAGMQIGFLFVEAGFVRSKNSINVSMKNLADFVIAVLSFHVVGAAIIFGPGIGFAGFDPAFLAFSGTADVTLFLVFQALFCGTAATIVSGAVAERLRFNSYLILTLPLTALVYPIIGHWAWASGLPGGTGQGWLEAIGFFDFAGSSVVHLTGGAAALGILLVVGPRHGRFSEGGDKTRAIHGHSPILAGSGALMLLVGWLGFNSGTLEPGTDEFANALANTLFAGCAGCLSAGFVGYNRDGFYRADRMINGLLIGLVAITASAPYGMSSGALIVGALAGGGSVLFADWMESKKRVDDAVYAVSVHGFGGVVGTLAVPFVVPAAQLPNSMLVQFAVQAIGVIAIAGFAFFVMYTAAAFMHRNGTLRVSVDEERQGLNQSEHHAMLGNAELIGTLAKINAGVADLSTRIDVDPFDEGGDIAEALNAFLDRVESSETKASQRLKAEQEETERLAARERDRADAGEALLSQFQLEFAALVQQLKTQAKELSQGSDALAHRTTQSGSLVDEASRQAESTVAMAEQMAQGANLLATTLDMVGRRVENANAAAQHADAASEKGSEIAGTLEQSTREIGKLVALIQAISEQTKILALNARIEAARAGDAGLGFAVVSEEVGQLADQTETASRDIGKIVGSLTELIGSSIAQFRAIDTSIECVREISAEAASAVNEQRATGSELESLIEETRGKAIQNGKAVARVSENFIETAPTIAQVDSNSNDLDALAKRIEQEVDRLRYRFTELGNGAEPAE
ncbi:MAG: methyl-accepting chemotaxis protein [Pseudomonadota bacterium]|nr:methyl-accepting chemotaxis protein [Pseudomonadota bacterium]